MKVEDYIDVIVENGRPEDMIKLSEMLVKLMHKTKETDEDFFKKCRNELYEMAFGKELTEDVAMEWVNSMEPAGKWSMTETTNVKRQYGITDISDVDFYVVMNMMYSNMRPLFGEDVNKYVEATKLWLRDPDVAKDKLYNYKMYVVD